MDRQRASGTTVPGNIQVVGYKGVLCIVDIESIDRFTIPIVGGYFVHRLFRMPFVEWSSFDQLGQPAPGMDALVQFLTTHHVIPKVPGNTISVKLTSNDLEMTAKRASPEPSTTQLPPKERIFHL